MSPSLVFFTAFVDAELFKDLEMNRPGKNGYRTPANKKRLKEEKKEVS